MTAYFVISMGPFRAVAARAVLRCLVDGLRWPRLGAGLSIPSGVASSLARMRERRQRCVRVLAAASTRGAWYRGLRLQVYDGITLEVPAEQRNRQEFGLPVAWRGPATFPRARLTALVEARTRAAIARDYGMTG